MKKILVILLSAISLFLIVINVIILKKLNDFRYEIYDYVNTTDYSVQRLYGKIENNAILFDNVLDAVELANQYTDNIAKLSEYEYNYVLQQHGSDWFGFVETQGSFQSDRDLMMDLFDGAYVDTDQSGYYPSGVYYDYYNTGDIRVSACWLEEEPDELYMVETTDQIDVRNIIFKERGEHKCNVIRVKRRFVHISENIYVMCELYEYAD